MIIAVDASGGEYAPQEIVKGAIKAAQEYNVGIILVGNKPVLHLLAGKHLNKLNISIVNASQAINFDESPIKAIHDKPKSSIVVGINLLKEGTASAFVSAGNSGAVVAAALLNLGKIEGIPRPAIGSFLNIMPATPTFLIDVGANVDCRPEHIVWFAHLGAIYVHQILNIDSPRIGLLNVGQEESKGNKLIRESHNLLKKTNLNFIGNIEGQDIFKGMSEVIVTDGFTGNILLKTLEGIGDNWLYSLNQVGQIFAKAYSLPLRALNRDIGMDSLAKRLDYQEYGGASLLGVNGNVIIAHGRSKAKAIKNAIRLANLTAERRISELIKEVKYGEPNVVDDSNFEQIVLQAKTPVLVDFWATWCGPCRMVAPIVEELADEYKEKVTFAKLDVDQNPKTATKYSIMAIPNLIIFKDGQPFSQIVGYKPKNELKKNLDDALK